MDNDQDRESVILRVEQQLKEFQGCTLKEADHFFSLDSLTDFIMHNTGLIVSRMELIDILEKLCFVFVNADGQRIYPMKVLS